MFLVDGETQEAALTYGGLDRRARAVAALLQGQGLAGERALLVYPPGLDYIVALMGCLYAGVVAVPTYPPRLNRPDPRLQAIVGDSQAAAALTTGAILTTLGQRVVHAPDMAALRWLPTDGTDAGLAEAWRDPNARGEDLAFLQYTSGSTAAPRGAMVTHANALYNAAMIHTAVDATTDSRGVMWLPPYHDMGLVGGILQTVYSGAMTTFMSPFAFLQRPLRWLQTIARTRATHSGGPNFAFDLCVNKTTPEQRAALDLSSWRVAFTGAEPVRPDTLERFADAFAVSGFQREAFCPAYGLAEATLLVTCGKPPGSARTLDLDAAALEEHRAVPATPGAPRRMVTSCGPPLDGETVAVVDPTTGARCPPGRIGEIWVSGPSVAQGYWNRPEESAEVFGARLTDSGEGPSLRTGDLGFMDGFALGGDSILSIRILARAAQAGLGLTPTQFFLYQTVAEQAAAIDAAAGATIAGEPSAATEAPGAADLISDADRQAAPSALGPAAGEVEDLYPLTPMQAVMPAQTLRGRGSGVYVEQLSCTVRGAVDAAAFEDAWRQAVSRHAVLRTQFLWDGLSEPVQVVMRDAVPRWVHHGISGASPDARRAELERYLRADLMRGFDLAEAPPLRFALFRLAPDAHHFVWTIHHLLLDSRAGPRDPADAQHDRAGRLGPRPRPAHRTRRRRLWCNNLGPTGRPGRCGVDGRPVHQHAAAARAARPPGFGGGLAAALAGRAGRDAALRTHGARRHPPVDRGARRPAVVRERPAVPELSGRRRAARAHRQPVPGRRPLHRHLGLSGRAAHRASPPWPRRGMRAACVSTCHIPATSR